ncbi:MAG: hypothetical protein AAFZ87_10430, partial [Planctomycetota bacterium]
DVGRVESASVERTSDPLATPTSDAGIVSAPDEGRGDALASQEASSVARRVSASASGVREETEPDADATGVLRGRVLDSAGTPVSGATVVVTARRSTTRRASKTDAVGKAWEGFDALEEELARTAQARLKSRRGTIVAAVDASGSFEATGLVPGRKYRARVYAADMVGDSIDARPGQVVEFVLEPVALFHLEPRLTDGTVPAEATVLMETGERRPRAYAWTADEPTLRLDQRVASLRVLAGEVHSVSWNEYSASLTSETRTVDLDVDGEGPHVFELEPQYLLEVDLVEPGLAFDNLSPWVDAKGPDDEEPRALRRTSDGPFVLNGLAPGSYTVRAGRTEDEPLVERAVEIAEASSALTLELPPIEPSDFLVVRCVDGSGRAVQDVTFRYRSESSVNRSSGGLRGDARPGGEHWIAWSTIRSQGIDVAGGFTLVARSKTLGARNARIASGAERVEITFASPADVTVLVQGASGRGGLGASLGSKGDGTATAMPWDQPNVVEVDSNGRAAFGRLQPGEYQLVVGELENGRWIREPMLTEDVTVAPGDQTLRVVLPDMVELVVHVEDAKKGQSVTITPEDATRALWSQENASIGADGTVRFTDLAPGLYRVNYQGQEMLVEVPCGEVLFVPAEVTGQIVAWIQEDKAGYEAGLRMGDVIVASSASEGGPERFQYDLQIALKQGPVTLEIERDGSRTSITVPSAGDGSETDIGVYMRSRLAR